MLASLGGGWSYAVYERWLLSHDLEELRRAQGEGDAAAEASDDAESGDVTLLRTNLEYFKKQVELLKKENESLAAAVQKLSTAATATVEGVASVDPAASAAPATTPEALVREIELIRELKFNPVPTFVPVPVTELERRIREAVEARMSPEQATANARAAKAIGWVEQTFDMIDALTGLTLEQAGGFYDPATNELIYDETADFAARPDLRGRLVTEIAGALVRQRFQRPELDGFGAHADDPAQAARAFVLGDAVSTKIHQGVLESLNNPATASSPSPAAAVGLANAPLYLRELFLFPYMMGSQFAQELSADGGPKALDAIYARLPLSTAEVLHPDLYQGAPAFTPSAVPWLDATVAERSPFSDTTVGEFGLYILLKRQLAEEKAYQAAEGWTGDRCLVFPGDDKGDHVYWRLLWRTEKDAREFFEAAPTFWLGRYSIPWNKRFEQSDNSFVVDDPHRIIRLRLDIAGKAVTVLDATDEAFADALEAALGEP